MKRASVFNIQRFSTHDGPGIRTVIFFKGCPLRCQWCANPESQLFTPELEVISGNCIGCGACRKVCPNNAISLKEKGIDIDREQCNICGLCAGECYSKTLKFVGEEMTAEQVVSEIRKDQVFHETSGGGVTFSGGEPLVQGTFCLEVLSACRKEQIHSAMETSGYGNSGLFRALAKELNLIFFDIKHFDSGVHEKLTGVPNGIILENLKSIQDCGCEIIVRTPVIPGCNDSDENIVNTARLCTELSGVKTWELLPYHNLGEHKYEAVGRQYEKERFTKPGTEHMRKLAHLANTIMEPAGKCCKVEGSGLV